MNRHPGGEEHTRHMLSLEELAEKSKILDMGAGAGETLKLLKSLGYEARGIDIFPRCELVEKGDFLNLPYPDGCFDAVISQCAFFISGDVEKALSEAHRVLKGGGVLLLSDLWFCDAIGTVEKAGFHVEFREDMTAQWREYYIDAIWRGEEPDCKIKGKCSYEMLICRRE